MSQGVNSGPGAARGMRYRDRSAARLAAVQALYQMQLAGATADAVIGEFGVHRLVGLTERHFDAGLFASIVRGVAERREALDATIDAALADHRDLARLEVVLACILRAGAFELSSSTAVPVRVVIDEYLKIAHDFFAGREIALINAVLDRLARILRVREVQDAGQEPAVPST